MLVIGEFADIKATKEIVELLNKRGIEANFSQKPNDDFYVISIFNDSDLALAEEVLRLVTGGPKSYAPAPEWKKIQGLHAGKLTWPLIGLCVGIYLLQNYFSSEVYKLLIFSNTNDLAEIKNFQLWRLITPCFMHFGFLHLLFNLMWWKDLSKIIEHSFSIKFLITFSSIVGALTNLSQYYISGPGFGGMSGVIFALFGLIWMLGRFYPKFSFSLPKSDIVLMVGWFIFCLTGLMNFQIANMAHAMGLSLGMLTGLGLSLYGLEFKAKKSKAMSLYTLLAFVFIFLGVL